MTSKPWPMKIWTWYAWLSGCSKPQEPNPCFQSLKPSVSIFPPSQFCWSRDCNDKPANWQTFKRKIQKTTIAIALSRIRVFLKLVRCQEASSKNQNLEECSFTTKIILGIWKIIEFWSNFDPKRRKEFEKESNSSCNRWYFQS